ncbi:MAG TPA: hypothetical protein VFA18_19655 [Gemmataceae bacterium]|nr:hypothetical protein [Gemmataceae bacterium]
MMEMLAPYWSALRIVAVVFGVLAGAIVGRVLASLTRRGKVRASLIIGGAGAGGVALWLAFSHLGIGLGGPGTGTGSGNEVAQSSTSPSQSSPAPSEKSSAGQRPEVVHVRMLGGSAVKDNRIYVLDGQPYTWDALQARLAAEQGQNPNFRTIEIDFQADSVDPENPAVQRLKDWAIQHQLGCRTYVPPGIGK